MNDLKKSPLLILDFGSQYTQLIARRVREMGVYCEIYPYHINHEQFKKLNPCGVILSGGPSTVTHDANPRAPQWLFEIDLPLLGICYGMQTMAVQLGGQVHSSALREFGYAELRLHGHSQLLSNIEDRTAVDGSALLDVWMSHGDKVTELPPGFKVICETRNAPIAGMADESRQMYGLQFHPEVTHTLQGLRILQRFVVDICKAPTEWTPEHIIDEAINKIREQVGTEKVLLGLSGGVDSSVVAALLHRAIGEQLVCVFVDTGLLRLNEAEQVLSMFGRHMGIRIIAVNAEDKFLTALKGVTCPEEKRKIIGRTFIEVFDEEAQKLTDIKWLAQGTIYPDVIESAATSTNDAAVVIKSHHNVGGLPDTLNLKLLEPIRELFKDEVRQVGLELGLPHDMVYRHPFPGPGLGVRILAEVKKEYADILRKADAIFIEELHNAQLYHKISQAFAVFLPVKSVGVMGDGRRYDYVICLRAVETVDFMTAHWSQLPWDFLGKVSNRIINEVEGVSRVTYDISGKPPATIEWE
ncbi:TPA: glutamine-hydrolyzing GMP synthase [Legionella pneumophila]|uniref:glutamine-hydrolyzing GMP synthase n=1 Tax=Legionella pneumophila TaxID=446 RepID=UPI000777AC25|nr:glutamine-hydrolyzing GMP synthase [Legionella pneumophila]HAT9743531.1 glutamine-hydrolyzing GMP synthase [Legionella pneumophila subsp. pneumophila]HAT8317235.1 glutamine-hydrolyzing GMP synthase [Legionella pneumophila]HAT8370598.1 glutamine-hydrolyzing GMP synthase [Legionella pneumophila]HAU1838683.1 glutamine-hydrolyzing GMP synthase [Legionella pneumophila]HAU9855911.1 glutamine-hydrolyzing GMP synthase [Legionella pneumophila]